MREISAILSDEIISKLEELSKKIKLSRNTIIENSLREYLSKLEQSKDEEAPQEYFNPVGFGMWKDRKDMEDSIQWVRNLREREWKR